MRFVFILSLFFCILCRELPKAAEAPSPGLFRIGIASGTIGNINSNDYAAAFKSWVVTVGEEMDLSMTASVKIVDVDENLRVLLLKGGLDALTLTVRELMFLNLQPDAVFVTLQKEDFHVRYVLIVRSGSGVTDIHQLKNCKIVTHNGHRMVLVRPWLEVSMAHGTTGPHLSCQRELTITENASKSIFQVFFRQAQAAVVEENAFELACELNPQLRKELTVLTISQPFIPSFFIFMPNYQGKYRKELEKAIVDVHTTPGGQQVLSIFQSVKMEKHPVSVLEPTREFLSAYQRWVQP